MTLSPTNHWLRRAAALLGLWIAALSLLPMAFADAALDKLIGNMQDRQLLISESYTQLDFRVNNMDPNDPRKEDIKKKLTDAQKAKDAFVNLVPKDNVNGDEPNATFTENEGKAIEAIGLVHGKGCCHDDDEEEKGVPPRPDQHIPRKRDVEHVPAEFDAEPPGPKHGNGRVQEKPMAHAKAPALRTDVADVQEIIHQPH